MASESTTFALIETGVYLLILAALLVMLKCLIGVARRRMLPRPKYVAIDRAFTDYDKHQNWSWDWCLVFPVREARERAPAPESLAQRRLEQYSLRFVVERLETGAGLETTLFRSHDRSAVFCKVRASAARLREEAARTDYTLALNPREVRRRAEAGGPRDAVGKASWYPRRRGWSAPEVPGRIFDTEIRDEFRQSLLPYDAHVYGPYRPRADLASAYATYLPSNSVFTGVDRLKLIRSIVEADAKQRGAQIDMLALVEAKVLLAAFPLHADGELSALMDRWIRWVPPWAQPIDAVKDYFGERIGLYFFFLGYYATWLGHVAAAGTLVYALMLIPQLFEGHRDWILPLFACFVSLWATLFLDGWRKREARKAMEWGTSGFKLSERPRPRFEGREIHSPVTGMPELYFPLSERLPRMLRAWAIIFIVLVGVFGIFACLFALQVVLTSGRTGRRFDPGRKFEDAVGARPGTLLCELFVAFAIFILGAAFMPLALHLNEGENHKTDSDFERHLIAKVFALQFCTAYGPLFYIAFAKDAVATWSGLKRAGCPEGCLGEVRSQLAIIFCVHVLGGNLLEVALPYARLSNSQRHGWDDEGEFEHPASPSKARRRQTSPAEEQFRRESYHHLLGTFGDYAEMCLIFGYTTLFVVAFPLAPLFAFVNSAVEIRTDAFKLCHNVRRPWPAGCATIGSWAAVLEAISWVATVTNALLVTFAGGFRADRTTADRLYWFIAYEAVLFGAKGAVRLLREDVPFEVALQLQRVNFLERKIIYNEPDEEKEPDDDDDEVSAVLDDTLVEVHDIDPEQNVKQLLDADRFATSVRQLQD